MSFDPKTTAAAFYLEGDYTESFGDGSWVAAVGSNAGTGFSGNAAKSNRGAPLFISGPSKITATSKPALTNSDGFSTWYNADDHHMVVVIDLESITGSSNTPSAQGIWCESGSNAGLGVYEESGTYYVEYWVVPFFGSPERVRVALPSDRGRFVIQAKKDSGNLFIRLNAGSWVAGPTGISNPFASGQLLLGSNPSSLCFDGTIRAAGFYQSVQDNTWSDDFVTWAESIDPDTYKTCLLVPGGYDEDSLGDEGEWLGEDTDLNTSYSFASASEAETPEEVEVNGSSVPYFDGTNDYLFSTIPIGNFCKEDGKEFTISIAILPLDPVTASLGTETAQTPGDNPGILTDDYWSALLGFCDAGVVAGVYDGVPRDNGGGENDGTQMVVAPCSAGEPHLVQLRFNSTDELLELRVDGGSWYSVPCGPSTNLSGSLIIGKNYDDSKFFKGTIGYLSIERRAISDEEADDIGVEAESLTGWSMGFSEEVSNLSGTFAGSSRFRALSPITGTFAGSSYFRTPIILSGTFAGSSRFRTLSPITGTFVGSSHFRLFSFISGTFAGSSHFITFARISGTFAGSSLFIIAHLAQASGTFAGSSYFRTLSPITGTFAGSSRFRALSPISGTFAGSSYFRLLSLLSGTFAGSSLFITRHSVFITGTFAGSSRFRTPDFITGTFAGSSYFAVVFPGAMSGTFAGSSFFRTKSRITGTFDGSSQFFIVPKGPITGTFAGSSLFTGDLESYDPNAIEGDFEGSSFWTASLVGLGTLSGTWSGQSHWSGLGITPGGPLPFQDPFDVYCVGPQGNIGLFLYYVNVQEFFAPQQVIQDYHTPRLTIRSGGGLPTTTAHLFVNVNTGPTWTLNCSFRITSMPASFSDVTGNHIFIGTADTQGGCAGLFISKAGLLYTGSVRFDGGNNLLLNSPTQLLPNSLNLIKENVQYTVRIVVHAAMGTTYIFVTETDQVAVTGHQLQYLLPMLGTDQQQVPVQDGTTISVRGTSLSRSALELYGLCLGNSAVIPNLPPVADAGVDQAARICSIVQLDGRRSFDPEGENLLYTWRLVDGPQPSLYVLAGDDGRTLNDLPQTDRFYSTDALDYEVEPGIASGDVLLVDGVPYGIVETDSDDDGFFIRINGFFLEPGLNGRSFRILKQSALSGKQTAQPTFYPDVPGLYKFDLVVFDGGLYSLPSITVINVTESPIPRGCNPDVKFLWNYISDFWRLVDNTEVLECFWGALAQIAASELLTLWQHEYAKSLRDIQRTFQRRWLHYDLFIQEPQVEQTSVQALLAGVSSVDLDPAVGLSVGGQTLVVQMPDGVSHELFFTEPEVSDPSDVVHALRTLLLRKLTDIDARFSVDLIESSNGSLCRLVVRAPFSFSFTESSTTNLFVAPASNGLLHGVSGIAVALNSYRVGFSLAGAGVQDGDYLIVNGEARRILRVTSDPGDPWESQRVVLSENLPLGVGPKWAIARPTRSSYLDFYSSLCSDGDTAFYEIVDKATGGLAYVPTRVLSAASDDSSVLLVDPLPIASFIVDDRFDVYFQSIYRRTHLPVDPLVVEVPTLQERIQNTDDTAVLRQNIDFFRTEFRGRPCLRFVTGEPDVWQHDLPPKRLWAETTYVDNRPVIEQNFGIPAEFTLDDLAQVSEHIDYLSCVRGLWYIYVKSPTIHNLRVGAQILLGLPFAEETGTIVEIDVGFSASQGRILVQDLNEQAIVRSYMFPRLLPIERNPDTGEKYKVGDQLLQFSPLVEGVELLDYIKDPEWFKGHLRQQSFYEIEKYFKFISRIDSNVFNLNALILMNRFLRRVKPTYTDLVTVVRHEEDATVDTSDEILQKGILTMFMGPVFYQNGQAQMWDQTRPSKGGWWNQYDTNDPDNPPVYPTNQEGVPWIHDQYLLSPTEVLFATLTSTFEDPETPAEGGIFHTGLPIYSEIIAVISDGQRFWVPAAGYEVGHPQVSAVTSTITKATVFLRIIAENNTPFVLTIKKNGSVVETHNFDLPFTGDGDDPEQVSFPLDLNISVVPGDELSAELAHGTHDFNTYVEYVAVVLGDGEDWDPGNDVDPGTYMFVRPL